ncbi:NUDIX domain-containing protein [Streptomyces antimicrobicus]|uniref:NUDIX domain-containing protein n=1 Tax=Streptomyces antimicrobicus TaxID=2883108 RepID=A0ABS8B3R8_9ACTN|nr:NUDIX domain-containing protein [Streptomyces antimicrobicus]MCB5179263.1 NUDIX domain-containing protein [Streptomyces antimicrobicus]
MTDKRSAGLLLFRRHGGGADGDGPGVEVLLGHMGGPYWQHKEARAWSIPKGEYGPDEHPRDAARREFTEEIGLPAPDGPYVPLGEVRQSNGKLVTVWAVEADLDPALMVPGTFTLEWPPGSGRTAQFPELDRVAWCTPEVARTRLNTAQVAFVERLLAHLHG